MDNSIKMDGLGGTPIFGNIHFESHILFNFHGVTFRSTENFLPDLIFRYCTRIDADVAVIPWTGRTHQTANVQPGCLLGDV